MANGILDVDGLSLFPRPSGLTPDLSINRPEFGGYGLLDDGQAEEWKNFRDNFAGGILNGYQYDPFGGHSITPINPSGSFSGTEPEGGPGGPGGSSGGGNGFFTMQEMMGFEAAMRGANWGNQDRVSAFSGFKDMGNGTYDVDIMSTLSPLLIGKDINGNRVPISEGVYQKGPKVGQPLSRGLILSTIQANLGNIDESGGFDGGGANDGPDNDGGADADGQGGSSGGNDGGGAGSGTGGSESGGGGGMGGGAGSW